MIGGERAFHSSYSYLLGTPETSFKGLRTRNARSALTSNALSSSDARNVLINLQHQARAAARAKSPAITNAGREAPCMEISCYVHNNNNNNDNNNSNSNVKVFFVPAYICGGATLYFDLAARQLVS